MVRRGHGDFSSTGNSSRRQGAARCSRLGAPGLAAWAFPGTGSTDAPSVGLTRGLCESADFSAPRPRNTPCLTPVSAPQRAAARSGRGQIVSNGSVGTACFNRPFATGRSLDSAAPPGENRLPARFNVTRIDRSVCGDGRSALELQRIAEGQAAALVDQLLIVLGDARVDAGNVACERQRLRHQLARRDNPVDEAPIARGLGVEEITAQRQFLGAAHADSAG